VRWTQRVVVDRRDDGFHFGSGDAYPRGPKSTASRAHILLGEFCKGYEIASHKGLGFRRSRSLHRGGDCRGVLGEVGLVSLKRGLIPSKLGAEARDGSGRCGPRLRHRLLILLRTSFGLFYTATSTGGCYSDRQRAVLSRSLIRPLVTARSMSVGGSGITSQAHRAGQYEAFVKAQ
jgi:hypothetical protein